MNTIPLGPMGGQGVEPVPRPAFGDGLEQAVLRDFGPGRGNYVVPTAEQVDTFRAIVGDTLQGIRAGDRARLERAAQAADRLGYTLQSLGGGDDGGLVLQERPEARRGWPTVVFNLQPRRGVVVEAPHPGFDHGTPQLAWQAFKAWQADVYVVAGAHRANRSDPSPDVPHDGSLPEYSISDMTHARVSLFEAAHDAAAHEGTRVVQFHGFSAGKHHATTPDFPADQQVVMSDAANDGYDPPGLVACQEALDRAGFKSRIVDFHGEAGSALGALPNVQHREMAERGLVGPGKAGEFIHLEFDTSVRTGEGRDERFGHIVEALRPVFLDPPH